VLHHNIEHSLRTAVTAVLSDANLETVLVRPCPDPKFGDYQCNALMGLAKSRKLNPRQLATEVVARLDVAAWCERVEIAGPGFLNFHLKTSALANVLREAMQDRHLFFNRASVPQSVVVDFSSPNVAKAMHVGHIRSTILGDCLTRVYRMLGHRVIADNHIGDWGTQFGKLLVGWKEQLDQAALECDSITEMERLYKTINAASELDPTVLEKARQELVKLQNGDPDNLVIWHEMIARSQVQFDTIYRRLGVQFDVTLGESHYNPRLKPLVQRLADLGIARESEGAMAVFFDDVPELKEHPALVQKSDGAANYTTTDLATLEYRWETWRPDTIIYVTDGRQQLHFKQLFTLFRRWHPEIPARLMHVWFGSILGPDGKPFKTRAGENIKLTDLLNEAEERAYQVVSAKSPELEESQRRKIAVVVGLGAIKYADLLPNRQSDYVFDWDKMLALNGNTAPYLLYAYTRIRSILRKREPAAAVEPADAAGSADQLNLTRPEEIKLAKGLLQFGLVLEAVAEECRPNYLCNYLYDLAGWFTNFYENCPVLKSSPEERPVRLALCELTGKVLRQGLEALGIETTELM
jgi:arginyl-tRNA synthetase